MVSQTVEKVKRTNWNSSESTLRIFNPNLTNLLLLIPSTHTHTDTLLCEWILLRILFAFVWPHGLSKVNEFEQLVGLVSALPDLQADASGMYDDHIPAQHADCQDWYYVGCKCVVRTLQRYRALTTKWFHCIQSYHTLHYKMVWSHFLYKNYRLAYFNSLLHTWYKYIFGITMFGVNCQSIYFTKNNIRFLDIFF